VFFASAHFCIWRDGKIVQLVWERNRGEAPCCLDVCCVD
jgi:hypothetical protein